MKTFNKRTKQKYIDRAIMHREQDEIIQGYYWDDSKGDCIGCLAHENDNARKALEDQTGIPEWLCELADDIHEGLGGGLHKVWPERFISAIPINTTDDALEKKVKAPFIVVVLKSTLENFDHEEFPDVKKAVDGSIALWERSDIGCDDWIAAARAAARAAWAASAAERAARAARAAWAASAAASAAASSASAAARAAARAAWAASAAERAARAARAAKYKYFSDELIKILEEQND